MNRCSVASPRKELADTIDRMALEAGFRRQHALNLILGFGTPILYRPDLPALIERYRAVRQLGSERTPMRIPPEPHLDIEKRARELGMSREGLLDVCLQHGIGTVVTSGGLKEVDRRLREHRWKFFKAA